uniref:N-acetyltransferase domain-containing protein 1 n=1 Tax=Globodera pallida TaxID=36090 RepID=A0A183BX00_GLOPA
MEEVAASTPTSRDQSQTRHIRHRKGSDHFEPMYNQQLFVNIENSIGGSAHQSTSNLMHSPKNVFENGQSQLVLELIGTEEEKPRYYSMPPEVQSEPAVIKLMQSGKKLHIYEGHIFVAVKPRGRDNMDVYKQQHFQHEHRGSGLARILEAQPS